MICIDIETIPNPQAIETPTWKRKKEKKEWDDHMAGLKPAFLQAVCIVATTKWENEWLTFSEIHDDEKELLTKFETWRRSLPFQAHRFTAFNGYNFDYPALAVRYMANRIKLPQVFKLAGVKPWNHPHEDLMEVLKCGGFDAMSMDDACFVFGVPSPKQGIDGSQVWDYWKEGKKDEILKYCMDDVKSLVRLRERLVKIGLLSN